tara:strand:- start:230907 stop:231320 length:414 start_codon:yes stop_codon:yes gene_type:complete
MSKLCIFNDCALCQNERTSFENGLTCNLTKKKPNVINTCSKIKLDEKYIENLKQYIINNESFEKKNNELVKLGRIKLLKYIVILILGILAGLYFGTVLKNLTHIKLFGYLGIFFGALITQIVINSYLIKINKSKHLV